MKKMLAIVMAFFTANWLWDIAHNSHFQGTGLLTNGIWQVPAITAYHLSWYATIACFIAMTFLYLKEKQKTEAEK